MRLKKAICILLAALLSAVILCSCEGFSWDMLFGSQTESAPLMSVHFLDVGQGDAIFVELPDDKTMLIDSGENYHGEGIINYIRDCGSKRIDYLIGTHPHSDHIGSMPYIIRNFEIGKIYMPEAGANSKLYEELLNAVKKKNRVVHPGKAGVKLINEDDLKVYMLAPVTIDEDNLNNSSIILKIEYLDSSFLFMADAELAEIDSVKLDMSADVIKIGHHGSRTSTPEALLDKVKPQIAVISVGADNVYGHPAGSVLKLLNKYGCYVYRTDLDGTVTITSDGEELHIYTGGVSIERAR